MGGTQPLGAQAHLLGGLLAADVQRPVAGLLQMPEHHVRERRLADPRRAAEQHQRARHETAAENAIELADAGRHARDRRRPDLRQRQRDERRARGHRRGRAGASLAGGSALTARGREPLLDERVPLLALEALAVPLRRLKAALRAAVDGVAGHIALQPTGRWRRLSPRQRSGCAARTTARRASARLTSGRSAG